MYYIYLYNLPYTRDVHTHFTDKTSEDKYLKNYQLNTNPIQCDRVLNPTAKSFRINLKDYPNPKEITYMIIVDNSNGEFYYYYVNDFSVLASSTVDLIVESDDYHTYFNNRGGIIDFTGNLTQSNSRVGISIDGFNKLSRYPTSEPFKRENATDFFKDNADYVPSFALIVYMALSKSGTKTLVYSDMTATTPYDLTNILEVLRVGELEAHKTGTTVTQNETYKIISCYIVPARLVGGIISEGHWEYKITYGVPYKFYEAGGTGTTKTITPNRLFSNFVGTRFTKLNIGNNETVKVGVYLYCQNSPPQIIISLNEAQFVNVIEDFGVTVDFSQEMAYYAQNKMSLGIGVLSTAGQSVKGYLTGNFSDIKTGLNSALGLINDCYRASEQPLTNVINSGNSVFSSGYGIDILEYSSKDNMKLKNLYSNYGGSYDDISVKFSEAINVDFTTTEKIRFYRFSLITKVEKGMFFKVENMFKSGIFIKYQ